MDLYADGNKLTGSISTDNGMVVLNSNNDITGSFDYQTGAPHVYLGIDYGHDYIHLEFNLGEGKIIGQVDEFIDCVADNQYDVHIECTKQAN